MRGDIKVRKKMSIFLKMFNCSFKRGSSRGFWEGRRGGDSREDERRGEGEKSGWRRRRRRSGKSDPALKCLK